MTTKKKKRMLSGNCIRGSFRSTHGQLAKHSGMIVIAGLCSRGLPSVHTSRHVIGGLAQSIGQWSGPVHVPLLPYLYICIQHKQVHHHHCRIGHLLDQWGSRAGGGAGRAEGVLWGATRCHLYLGPMKGLTKVGLLLLLVQVELADAVQGLTRHVSHPVHPHLCHQHALQHNPPPDKPAQIHHILSYTDERRHTLQGPAHTTGLLNPMYKLQVTNCHGVFCHSFLFDSWGHSK